MTRKLFATLWDHSVLIFDDDNSSIELVESLFPKPVIENEKVFDANDKIEDDEFFFIAPSIKQKEEMIWQYLAVMSWSASTNIIKIEDYKNIKALYLIEENEEWIISITFSKVFPKQKITSANYLSIEWEPVVKTRLNSIDITGEVHAFWDWEKLFFKHYKTIMGLFPWISDFYITATPKERDDFLNNGFFNLKKTIKVWDRNMKRIAFILKEKSIDFLDEKIREKYKNYASKYKKSLNFDSENKVDIETNNDLTIAIQVIEEHFYTSEITGEPREAENSKKIDASKA